MMGPVGWERRVVFGRPVDSLYPVSEPYGRKDKRYEWSIDPDNGLWIPVKGPHGLGQHRGIDFDCPIGTLVRAMADGIVLRARFESAIRADIGAGLYVLQLVSLPGYDSWAIRYSHLKAVFVRPGQKIVRYEAFAESGNSGDALRPFLHIDLMNLRRQWCEAPLDA